MHLNIKNAETRELAIKLSRMTGESITGAVTRAIKGEIGRLSGQSRRSRLRAIVARSAPALKEGPGSADIDALLYDEMGLPR